MPEDGLDQLRGFDVIYFGAVGYPRCPRPYFAVGFVDPHSPRVSAVRQPAAGASAPGIDSPLKNFPPGQIDMCIVRENIANPIAQIWSGAMMFEHLGQRKAARGGEKAFEAVLARPDA
jgi:tartrate dehydrogenase/decarboxylase/D-malate dehydrogenase